jgi:hypothetical protein
MLKEFESLVEAERLLDAKQLQIWGETRGRAWEILCNALRYVKRRQAELLADN